MPFLKAKSPNIYQIPRLGPKDAPAVHQLTFEIQSEDLNQTAELPGQVILDFPGFTKPFPDDLNHRLKTFGIPPGHLTPQIVPGYAKPQIARQVETTFVFPHTITLGCHSVSVIVSHQFKYSELIEPVEDDDIAILTWWYLLLPSPEMGDLPADATQCFYAPDPVADGGSDAGPEGGVTAK